MPPRKQWIDKKNATTYQLFHRSQNDPLIHDPSADDRVLAPHLADLQQAFGGNTVRKNEGEAANYGIYYDDSKYDYMQHMRDLGQGAGDTHFIEAKTKGKEKAGKGMRLEDALRQVSLDEDRQSQVGGGPESVYSYDMRSTASSYVRNPTYQDQQNVPDAIAGFQPDMDPRLREVLEALEDEEYVDGEDEDDLFGQLTTRAEEMDQGDWEDTLFDNVEEEDDDGWESDATEKAPVQMDTTDAKKSVAFKDLDVEPGEMPEHDEPAPDLHPEDQGWMREFAKFKKDGKSPAAAPAAPPSVVPSEQQSTLASTVFTVGGTPIRRKKRKGALTNPSAYSMTSSALARTEGHRLLDDRFDRVEALYALDEEDEFDDSMSMVSGMTGMTGMSGVSAFSTASSQAPSLVNANGDEVRPSHNFNNIMDDFLAGWDGKTGAQAKRKGAQAKRGKNGNEAIGIKMLDEVRQGLGPARISGKVPGRA
ncbi:low-temperature viability protein ltv1 [Aspergillus heteromorphus CBS 117.55]|uniref:Low-temperature viability protein ltv1 n=1 Tax=Aspergillus heteromorphus CBS 117.55 TaxID=1448321 RepID=A0A317V7A0_9EURO|nr:low-temperature viability protein ltv1 [Aspergillus heteromorphus CBS 117.55]PWY70244.1 low-temperature viability protein ltv1 [Aspergillus heteromorphus CBS 117.55]